MHGANATCRSYGRRFLFLVEDNESDFQGAVERIGRMAIGDDNDECGAARRLRWRYGADRRIASAVAAVAQ